MSQDCIVLPCAKITPSKIVIYDRVDFQGSRRKVSVSSLNNLSRGVYNGFLSMKTRSKIRTMLDCWLGCVESRVKHSSNKKYARNKLVTFVTLTLPAKQFHSDKEIKRKTLIPFIQDLIEKQGVTCYFWRAEPQKNGNIHFHILVNRYIHHAWIRQEWNRYMSLLGYVGKYSERMKNTTLKQYINERKCKDQEAVSRAVLAYKAGVACGWVNPNSTDIHGLEKVHSTSAYVCKYVSKKNDGRDIEGRIWGCSDNLRLLRGFEVVRDQDVTEYIQLAKSSASTKVYKGENFEVLVCDQDFYSSRHGKQVRRDYVEYMRYCWDTISDRDFRKATARGFRFSTSVQAGPLGASERKPESSTASNSSLRSNGLLHFEHSRTPILHTTKSSHPSHTYRYTPTGRHQYTIF